MTPYVFKMTAGTITFGEMPEPSPWSQDVMSCVNYKDLS